MNCCPKLVLAGQSRLREAAINPIFHQVSVPQLFFRARKLWQPPRVAAGKRRYGAMALLMELKTQYFCKLPKVIFAELYKRLIQKVLSIKIEFFMKRSD